MLCAERLEPGINCTCVYSCAAAFQSEVSSTRTCRNRCDVAVSSGTKAKMPTNCEEILKRRRKRSLSRTRLSFIDRSTSFRFGLGKTVPQAKNLFGFTINLFSYFALFSSFIPFFFQRKRDFLKKSISWNDGHRAIPTAGSPHLFAL